MTSLIPARLTVVRTLELLLAVLLTVTVLPRWGVPVDLVLVLVVAVGLRAGTPVGALFGLVAGLLVDVVPPGSVPLGATALVYAAIGAGAGVLHRSVRASVLLPAACLLLAAAAVQLVRLGVAASARQGFDLGHAAALVVLTAVVGALLVPAVMRLEHHLVARGMV